MLLRELHFTLSHWSIDDTEDAQAGAIMAQEILSRHQCKHVRW